MTTTDQKLQDDDVQEITQIDSGVLTAISRAELDQQITTARAYPRSIKRFQQDCLSMATLSVQIAEECIYALPRDGKTIEGPSARMAEIVASSWGNCRAGARVVDEGPEFVTAQGVFHDLQRNVQITMEVRRRITNKWGKRFGADMIGVTGNAACSIALRNAVFRGIPKALWTDVYDQVRKTIMGDAQTLANRRSNALSHLQKFGASEAAVLARLGVEGIEDIGLDHIVTLRGIANSIKEGETTVEAAFPEPTEGDDAPAAPKQQKPAKGVGGLASRIGGDSKPGDRDAGPADQEERAD